MVLLAGCLFYFNKQSRILHVLISVDRSFCNGTCWSMAKRQGFAMVQISQNVWKRLFCHCRYAKGPQGKAGVAKKPPLDMVCIICILGYF